MYFDIAVFLALATLGTGFLTFTSETSKHVCGAARSLPNSGHVLSFFMFAPTGGQV
jgi:hypothetical protein